MSQSEIWTKVSSLSLCTRLVLKVWMDVCVLSNVFLFSLCQHSVDIRSSSIYGSICALQASTPAGKCRVIAAGCSHSATTPRTRMHACMHVQNSLCLGWRLASKSFIFVQRSAAQSQHDENEHDNNNRLCCERLSLFPIVSLALLLYLLLQQFFVCESSVFCLVAGTTTLFVERY